MGGLMEYGIPGMKLSEAVLDRKAAAMQTGSVKFLTGIGVGGEISAGQLRDGYDAVVLCVGTGNDWVGIAIRRGCAGVVQLEMMSKNIKQPIIYSPYPNGWQRRNLIQAKKGVSGNFALIPDAIRQRLNLFKLTSMAISSVW